MKTFAIVHNVPTPYRDHLFRTLRDRLRRRGVAQVVHFMAATHPARPHWRVDVRDLDFEAVAWRDAAALVRWQDRHLNPGLIAHLHAHPPDYLLVCGPWASLTALSLSIRPPRSRLLGMLEANVRTVERYGSAARPVKRWVLSRYDAVTVPGQLGLEYLHALALPAGSPPRALLPNIVDERLFRIRPAPAAVAEVRRDLGIPKGDRLALWNARLIPQKGIGEFLSLLEPADLRGWQVRIFGEGPELGRIRRLLETRGLDERVSVRPYVAYGDMPLLYASADLLLLASRHDPNPLSVIEAMHSGLPLLVSDRIGNHPEALAEGENGYTLPVDDPELVRSVALRMFRSSDEQLARMGEASRARAERLWSSVPAVDAFLDAVGVPASTAEARAVAHA
jgi:glycosyltransferase involved in cell wall biosynthesis